MLALNVSRVETNATDVPSGESAAWSSTASLSVSRSTALPSARAR
jgi:hypothetical protein